MMLSVVDASILVANPYAKLTDATIFANNFLLCCKNQDSFG